MDEVKVSAQFQEQVDDLVEDLFEVLRAHRDAGVPIDVVPSALGNLCLGFVNACSTKEAKANFIAGLVAFLTQNATVVPVTKPQ